jgi:DNA-binding HxlR family transcriptional regulator
LKLRHSDVTATQTHSPGACKIVGSILSRVGDKWTVLLVMMLANGPRRFNELKRDIGGISQRMLTLTLRGLERDGLVTRTMFATVPPRVDYELTELGHSLRGPIEALGNWAFANLPMVEQARAAFDAPGRQVRLMPAYTDSPASLSQLSPVGTSHPNRFSAEFSSRPSPVKNGRGRRRQRQPIAL